MSYILRNRTLTQMLQLKAEVQSQIDMLLLERGMLQLNLSQSSSDEKNDTIIENTQEDCEISDVCETTYMNNNHFIDENQNYVKLHDEIKISSKETQTNLDEFKNQLLDLKEKLVRAEKLNQTLSDKIKRKDRYFSIMTEKNQDIISKKNMENKQLKEELEVLKATVGEIPQITLDDVNEYFDNSYMLKGIDERQKVTMNASPSPGTQVYFAPGDCNS